MVVRGALAQAFALPLLGAYGLVATPLIEEFGASPTELGIGMSLAILAAALAGPALGVLLDRGPLRAVMLAGVALMWVSVLLLSRGRALWQLGACLAFATLGMSMYGMMPAQVVLVNWFVLQRGRALSFAFVGTSLAAFVVPPATAFAIEGLGWRGALVALASAAALLACGAIAGLVKRPEERGQSPDGLVTPPHRSTTDPASGARSEPPRGGASREASGVQGWLSDANFWLIAIGVGLALSVSVATLFLVRHLETLGFSRTEASFVPSLMALFGIVGKLAAGWAIDRFDARAVVPAALLAHALGWVIVATQSSYGAMLVAAAPLGLGGGGFLPLPAVLQGRCFGRAAIGRVSGLHALLGLPFLLAAAPLVGSAASEDGGFAAPFLGLAVLLALAALVLAGLRVPAAEPE
jgi:sugar phosphate permease